MIQSTGSAEVLQRLAQIEALAGAGGPAGAGLDAAARAALLAQQQEASGSEGAGGLTPGAGVGHLTMDDLGKLILAMKAGEPSLGTFNEQLQLVQQQGGIDPNVFSAVERFSLQAVLKINEEYPFMSAEMQGEVRLHALREMNEEEEVRKKDREEEEVPSAPGSPGAGADKEASSAADRRGDGGDSGRRETVDAEGSSGRAALAGTSTSKVRLRNAFFGAAAWPKLPKPAEPAHGIRIGIRGSVKFLDLGQVGQSSALGATRLRRLKAQFCRVHFNPQTGVQPTRQRNGQLESTSCSTEGRGPATSQRPQLQAYQRRSARAYSVALG